MIVREIKAGCHDAWITENSGDFYVHISHEGEDDNVDDGVTLLLTEFDKLIEFVQRFKIETTK